MIEYMQIMKNENKSRLIKWILYPVLLALFVANFLFWADKKEIGYADEVYTYESVNGFEQVWPRQILDEWMDREVIVSYLAADSDSLQLTSISNVLYGDHVPLYFWLTRFIALTFFKHQATMWVCLSSNLFFYLLAASIVFFVLCKLTSKPGISFLMVLATMLYNRTVLEQTTMLRMYIMLLALVIGVLVCALSIFKKAKEGKLAVLSIVFLTITGLTGLLTHYDFWIFYALTSFCVCLYMLILGIKAEGKKYYKTAYFKNILGWIVSFLGSLGITILLFPYCVWNLHKGKGWAALSSVSNVSKDRFGNILWGFERLSNSFFGPIPAVLGVLIIALVFAFAIFILLKKKTSEKVETFVLTVVISLLYQMAVCFTLPDVREERYVWCSNTILYLCFVYALFVILSFWYEKKSSKVSVSVTAALLAVLLVFAQFVQIDGGRGICYLEYESKDMQVLYDNSDLQWVIYGPCEAHSFFDFINAREICFMSNTESEADYEAAKHLCDSKSFLIYAYPSQVEDAERFFEDALSKELTFTYLTQSTNYSVYLVTE